MIVGLKSGGYQDIWIVSFTHRLYSFDAYPDDEI
jgi:hypothetical protein